MAKFHERLRLLRKESGLSQQEFADLLGSVSKSSINMYERGEREPSLETLEHIADFFNVDLDYLLGKADIRHKYIRPLTHEETDAVTEYFLRRMDITCSEFEAWRDYLISLSSVLAINIDLTKDDSVSIEHFFEVTQKIINADKLISNRLKELTSKEKVQFKKEIRIIKEAYESQMKEYHLQKQALDNADPSSFMKNVESAPSDEPKSDT